MTDQEDEIVGKRIMFMGKHPHAGSIGTVVRVGNTIFGKRPVVKLESGNMIGHECYIMRSGEAKEIV